LHLIDQYFCVNVHIIDSFYAWWRRSIQKCWFRCNRNTNKLRQ